MGTVNKIGNELQHLTFMMSRQSDQVLLERLGLGYSQFKILSVLLQKPHIQQKEIAFTLGQTEASVSRQIKLLTEQGLLQAIKRPENKRQRITTLTPKGERYIYEAIDILDKFHGPVFESLSKKQTEALQNILTTMHSQICSVDKNSLCHDSF